MDEINIPRRFLIIGILVSAVIAAAVWGAPRLAKWTEVQANTLPTATLDQLAEPVADDDRAREAAIAGAQAFYTVDYQAQQVWLDRLCAVSTQTGCVVYQNVIGPNLWPKFEEANTITSVEVGELEKVQEQTAPSRGNAPMQVWRMLVHLSAPWIMQPEPITQFSTLALVLKENGVWKFERFLTEEEIQAKFLPEVQP